MAETDAFRGRFVLKLPDMQRDKGKRDEFYLHRQGRFAPVAYGNGEKLAFGRKNEEGMERQASSRVPVPVAFRP
jgi:hypothetical protein